MTIGAMINKVDGYKMNSFPLEVKLSWVSQLLKKIDEEVYQTHERDEITYDEPLYVKYDPETKEISDISVDTEIELPEAHLDVMEYYIMAMIDFYNSDLERYTNSLVMFNNAYSDYKKWYHRNHMPLGVR